MSAPTTAECVNPDRFAHRHLAACKLLDPDVTKLPLRVLVVDDEPLIRWSVAETLADLGMEVQQAVDAASAIRAIESAGPAFDVIVLDLRLPDMDDLTLVSTIRQRLPATAVILMTAFGTPEVVADARDLGVTDILSKPFEMAELSRAVLAAGGAPAT
jgi:DNA-binding NtrC family response regulator